MTITTTTHLNFDGDARPALEFYASVFDGALTVVTYRDADAAPDDIHADQVMWGQVRADNGFHVMAYDVVPPVRYAAGENPFFVCVRAESVHEITTYWDKLSAESTVVIPLAPAGWAPAYGMLKDRFGVVWVLDVTSG